MEFREIGFIFLFAIFDLKLLFPINKGRISPPSEKNFIILKRIKSDF